MPDVMDQERIRALRAEVESLQAQLAAARSLLETMDRRLLVARSDLAAVRTDLSVARRQIERLQMAVRDAGSQPEFHRRTMARHRSEWPTLWEPIDGLIGRAKGKPWP